jgi:hypothetical protein
MPIWGRPTKDAPNFKFSYGEAVPGIVIPGWTHFSELGRG